MLQRLFTWMAVLWLLPLAPSAAGDQVTYEEDVQPILREHCFACHNQDDATAGLALDSFEGLTTGGASGEVVAAGDPDASRLWKLVTHQEAPNMPPDNKLPEQALQILRGWIEGGLLQDANSRPLQSRRVAIVKLDSGKFGKPVGEPAIPEQLFHESVLWTPRTGPIDALATSPWAPLAAIAWQRQISFYDTNTRQLLGILPYVDGVPQVVRFSRDGSLLLVAGGRHAASGSAALFDVKTGARLATLGDELDIVLAADISADHSLVALGGPKKTVRVYKVADGSLAYQLKKHTDWITALAFSPDGRLLATADRNGSALLWQAAAGHERAELRGHKQAITSLDWRADAAMVATASEDGSVRLWNPAGDLIQSVEAHKSGVLSIRFSRDGNWVTAGRDRHVKTWNADGGAIAGLGKLPGMALAAAFSHDGSQVLASDFTGEVRLIDVATKKKVATLLANPPLLSLRLTAAETALRQAELKLQADQLHEKAQRAAFEQGQAAQKTHEIKLAQVQTALGAARDSHDERTEAAGLMDLEQLAEQHAVAEAEVASAQKHLQQAQQAKAQIATQQARFDQAAEQFASQSQARQSHYQELVKDSQQAAKAHRQAARQLARHRPRLVAVAKQLQAIQGKLAELEATDSKLQQQEIELATELGKIETAVVQSMRQFEMLEASKRDFAAAEALRKSYRNE